MGDICPILIKLKENFEPNGNMAASPEGKPKCPEHSRPIEKGECVMSVGLVLEGGGTRGAYTSGVLDVFNENRIVFPVVYGISAGACNALSYISGQVGRNFRIFYDYIQDDRYMSVASLRKTGNLFGFDFIFGELSHKLLPFDYQAFFASPIQLMTGTTDLHTGDAIFWGKEDLDEGFTPVRASSAMPFVSKIVAYQGYELLDGSYSTSIPLQRSLDDGNARNVVVLTRDASYRKGTRSEYPRTALRRIYGKYPRFIEAVQRRPQVYNCELDLCSQQEREGKAVLIRPSKPIPVGRYEKNPERLKQAYEMGRKDAERKLPQVRALLAQG